MYMTSHRMQSYRPYITVALEVLQSCRNTSTTTDVRRYLGWKEHDITRAALRMHSFFACNVRQATPTPLLLLRAAGCTRSQNSAVQDWAGYLKHAACAIATERVTRVALPYRGLQRLILTDWTRQRWLI